MNTFKRKIMYQTTVIFAVVFALALVLTPAHAQNVNAAPGNSLTMKAESGVTLTITGDGVERETTFTLAELEGIAVSQNAYTAWNTWPAKATYYVKGVPVSELLNKAGLKNDATTIIFAEAPAGGVAVGGAGYNMSFLLSDLLAERYTFVNGKKPVPAVIATAVGDKSFAAMDSGDLRLIYGQLDEQEQTSAGFVKSVRVITVTRDAVRRLDAPAASAELLANGRYSVTLTSANVNAKIYYTTDGSAPNVHSAMYNISAPHWQPKLNAPFEADGDAVVKAVAVAMGFADSEILSFTAAGLAGGASVNGASTGADAVGAPIGADVAGASQVAGDASPGTDGAGGLSPATGGTSIGTDGAAGMRNFVKTGSYKKGQFSDVDDKEWYAAAVADAFEYGLMKGVDETAFNPLGNMSVAEAITIAARIHSIYATGADATAEHRSLSSPAPWYQSYVDYAIANNIIKGDEFYSFTRSATRAEMAYIFSRALPQSEYGKLNSVNRLPDVTVATPFNDSIFTLYGAGVLAGSDAQGTFYPGRGVLRAEAAAIVSRVILPGARISGRTYQ